jgi:hypothetical protein
MIHHILETFGLSQGKKYAEGGQLGVVEVKFSDPKYNYQTNVNPKITEKEAREYFVGKRFDLGVFPNENLQECIDIDFTPANKYADGGGVGEKTNEELFTEIVTYLSKEHQWEREKAFNLVYSSKMDSEIREWLKEGKSTEDIARKLNNRYNHEYEHGGSIEDENKDMVLNNNKQIRHHTEELMKAVQNSKHIPAWVVAKIERSATDISDATHFLEGEKMANGGTISKFNPLQLIGLTFYNKFTTHGEIVDVEAISDNNIKVTYESSKTLEITKSFTKKELFEMSKGKEVNGNLIFKSKKLGESSEKMANGGMVMKRNKVAEVMREFVNGELKTAQGKVVNDRLQALAIAMSEAGLSKKEMGGFIESFRIPNYNLPLDYFALKNGDMNTTTSDFELQNPT